LLFLPVYQNKNTVWVLYPTMKAREKGDSDGITLEEELD
jgi:hypothetical protein